MAKEFVRLFDGLNINKIVTIEASGIAPAILVGYLKQLPVVFIKKKQPKTMDNMLSTVVHSFTKDRDYTVCISNSFLTPDDHVLFIDDFLANGNAANGVQQRYGKPADERHGHRHHLRPELRHPDDPVYRSGAVRYPVQEAAAQRGCWQRR